MRTIAVLAVALAAAAVNAIPAPAPQEVTVTVTDIVDVTTTVWETPTNEALVESSSDTTSPSPTPAPAAPDNSQASSPPPPPPPPATAAATSTPAAPAAATGSYDSPNGDTYAQNVLNHHNIHRQNNSASSMNWNGTLASIALQIANSCYYAHNIDVAGGGYGQNIAAGAPADNITSVITDLFYNDEIENFNGLYGQATPDNIDDETAFDGYGHYTQIVWVGSTDVGCATVDCTSQGLGNVGSDVPPFFTVCNYYPPGKITSPYF